MKHIDISFDINNRLVLIDNSTNKLYKDGEAIYILMDLLNSSILRYLEDQNGLIGQVHFDNNVVLNIKNPQALLLKNQLRPLLNKISNFQTQKQLSRSKKVKRRNKYKGVKVVATGLALATLLTIGLGTINNISISALNLDTQMEMKEDIKEESDIILEFEGNNYINIDPQEEKIPQEVLVEKEDIVSLNYEDNSSSDKAINASQNYGSLISKYSKIYGLDSNLMLSIATQERGIHSREIDEGGGIGLMQVQYDVWVNEEVSANNFETGERETFVVDGGQLSDLEYNVKVGCMIFQTCLRNMNYNTLAAIQCYNMGYGNMMTILNNCSIQENKSIDDILNNPMDTDWLNYRYLINEGDQNYIENVLSWSGSRANFINLMKDGTEVCFNCSNNESKKVY